MECDEAEKRQTICVIALKWKLRESPFSQLESKVRVWK